VSNDPEPPGQRPEKPEQRAPNVWGRPPGGCTLQNRHTYATRCRTGSAEQAAVVDRVLE